MTEVKKLMMGVRIILINKLQYEHSIPDCQVVVVEELMQSRQLGMFLFHKTPLDQSCIHIPCLTRTKTTHKMANEYM